MLFRRLLFTIAVLLAYSAIAYNVTSRVFSPTGDEPHYLVITHSLAMDRDISLLNNYQGQHYRLFYDSILAKRTTASADKKREIPTFGLGMPLFLAPWYKTISNNAPHKLVAYLRIVICLIAAVGIYQLLSFGLELGGSPAAAFLITTGAAFASPLVTYSSQFYPEIFAFALLITGLRTLRNRQKHPWLSAILLCLIPGLLMWLHPKYLALALVLTGMVTVLIYRDHEKKISKMQIVHLVIALVGIATFFVFLKTQYGSWSPNRIYGGWQKQASLLELLQQEGTERLGVMVKMLFGFWFDERFGLLPFAPFYVAFFAALIWCVRKRQNVAFPALILFALHFLPLCWGAPLGGYAPPARHFVVMIPLILTPVFLIYSKWISEQKILLITMQLGSIYIAFRMLTNYRKIFANVTWRNPDGGSEFWPLLNLERWIPNCIASRPEYALVFFWLLGTILFVFCLYPREEPIVTSHDYAGSEFASSH
ncbi:hypothetical protein L0222_27805 [bacterium]|nr:hypothetical protein [bacterium]MCI0602021.1 hypothetical protein [bacterium]